MFASIYKKQKKITIRRDKENEKCDIMNPLRQKKHNIIKKKIHNTYNNKKKTRSYMNR